MDNAHRDQLNRILERNRARKGGSVSVGGVPLEEPSAATNQNAPAPAAQQNPTLAASPNPQPPRGYSGSQQQQQGHTVPASPLAPPGVTSAYEQPAQAHYNGNNQQQHQQGGASSKSQSQSLSQQQQYQQQQGRPPVKRPPPSNSTMLQGGATPSANNGGGYGNRSLGGQEEPQQQPPQFEQPVPHQQGSGVRAEDSGAFGPTMATQATFHHSHPQHHQNPGVAGSGGGAIPGAAQYSAPPRPSQGRSGSISGSSTATLNQNLNEHNTRTGYVQPGTEDLFRKGTFSNFRDRPLLTSPNVRSYRREPSQSGGSGAGGGSSRALVGTQGGGMSPNSMRNGSPRYRGGSQTRGGPNGKHEQHLARVQQEAHEHPVEKNPFRTQEYEDFTVAPRYEAPSDIQEALDHHKIMIKGSEGSVGHALTHDRELQAKAGREGGAQQPAVFDLQQCIAALSTGDWFLKWTRRKDKVHRRYFWLDVGRSLLYWGKTPDAYTYLSSSIRIEDITALESQCVVDDASGKTLYLLIIGTTTRVVQMGTEQRDKFDVWFDTMTRLSDTVREYNARYYARYAGNKMPTQAQGRVAARNQLSSAD